MNELLQSLANRHGGRILAALEESTSGGLTDFELADRLGIYLSSVNAARNRLMRDDLVHDSGKRRPSGRGGTATVWAVSTTTSEGIDA